MSEEPLPVITDEEFTAALAQSRPYTLVILKRTDRTAAPESRPIIWEHGRRNISLRAAGILAVVCPVADESDVAGVGLFTRSPVEVAELMEGDPAIAAGILTYEVHPVRSFPGDALP